MTDRERAIQRFIDGESTPEERIQLLKAVGDDEKVRLAVLELETIAAAAAALPRLTPPPACVAQVVRRLPATRSRWRPLVHAWTVPRPLFWRPAGVFASALLLLILGGLFGRLGLHPGRTPAPVPSDPTVLVRLVMIQPDAASVAVAGDFNGWNPERTPLVRSADGVWTATVPLKPGRYHYMYVVDGRHWLSDPFAADVSVDGFGAENAVLDIEPPL
ncbi:isoamylase early set domain-containing protein [Candidatus Nitrospira bockiana]